MTQKRKNKKCSFKRVYLKSDVIYKSARKWKYNKTLNIDFTFLNDNYILIKTFSLKIKKLFIRVSLFKFKNYLTDSSKEKER